MFNLFNAHFVISIFYCTSEKLGTFQGEMPSHTDIRNRYRVDLTAQTINSSCVQWPNRFDQSGGA